MGFDQGQVTQEVCSGIVAFVPYDVMRPHLSELGEELVAGVREPRPAARADDVSPLAVSRQKTPRLRLRRYDTRGTYPTVSGADGLDVVNAAILAAVRRDQAEFAARAREEPAPATERYRGLYETDPPAYASASTRVASFLIPVRELFPGGNDGNMWMATTVRVPSGEAVTLTDLFADRARALRAIAREARHGVVTSSRCVARSLADPIVGHLHARRLRPLARNYRQFALAPEGLAFGFYQAQIAAPPCGRISTLVPYDVVRPHLNEDGRALVAGVRR